jgi:catechol 2,3-dioxygenase-like lactoylglutathione lyase family enzyme
LLGDHPIDVVLLAPDLAGSRRFYRDVLGLEVLAETSDAVTFSCGGSSRLVVSASTTGTADSQTQAMFRVDDLAAELADLRGRGVEILEYDEPGFVTVDGIIDTGDALHAFIRDPGGNCLGVDQLR